METRKILTILVLALGLLLCPVAVSETEPMGTAFTYQGRLIDTNSAADGVYDFSFSLYDANTSGNKVGGDVNIRDIDVVDGHFAVKLDFGTGVFDGKAVWMTIGVRPAEINDPNGYTALNPRQEITPTPYATHATNANTLDGLLPSGFAPASHLHNSVYAPISHSHDGTYALITHDHDSRYYTETELQSDGSANVHWNNLANVPNGFADGVDDTGGSDSDWTVSGADMYSAVSGNVGIGTASTSYKFDVNHSGFPSARIGSSSDIATVFDFDNTSTGGRKWRFQSTGSATGRAGQLEIADTTAPGTPTRFTIDTFGNVGFGTTSPDSKLEVQGGPIKATGGLIIETRTSDPAGPVTGRIWLRTDIP